MTLEDMRAILEKCARCGTCRAKCPSLEANEEGVPGWDVYGPRGRMQLAFGLLENKVQPTKMLQDGIFTCFFCNQCVVTCPSLANVTDVILETRRYLAEQGNAAPQVLQAHDTIAESKNMFGLDQADRVELWSMDISDLVEDHVGKPAHTLFFVGCQGSFKGDLASIPVRVVQILDKIGEDFTLLGEDEMCCGNPLELTGGAENKVRELAEANVGKIEALGVQQVIFTCPGCYRTFSNVYPKLIGRALTFKPMMFSEFILGKINDGTLTLGPLEGIGTVVYHDPCELGRHMGIYDVPREVIASIPGIELVEFKANRENCNCCGMGGGVAIHDMKVSEFQARNKARDIEETGAAIVVTHCPACFQGIAKSCEIVSASGKTVKVMDLAEIVAKSMGID